MKTGVVPLRAPGATLMDVKTPQEIADELAAARVDASLSVARMVEVARRAGVRAQTGALKAGAVEYKRRLGQSVEDPQPPGTCRRADAAGLIGVSVKRIDQLRAEGRLRARRHPFTGTVWIDLDDVRAERARRGLDGLVAR